MIAAVKDNNITIGIFSSIQLCTFFERIILFLLAIYKIIIFLIYKLIRQPIICCNVKFPNSKKKVEIPAPTPIIVAKDVEDFKNNSTFTWALKLICFY